ncbi:Imm42 family immunity protein [Acinetobacter baumannii]|nr:Imm42 family immunity protein [Acinetobacter baumannii]
MIVKYSDDFFIQWDVVYPLKKDLNLGVFNFWINDKCYPAKGINITLNSILIF